MRTLLCIIDCTTHRASNAWHLLNALDLLSLTSHAAEDLVKKKIRDHQDFEWLKQCRFYWREDRQTVVISICDVDFDYSFEYLGEPLCQTQKMHPRPCACPLSVNWHLPSSASCTRPSQTGVLLALEGACSDPANVSPLPGCQCIHLGHSLKPGVQVSRSGW